ARMIHPDLSRQAKIVAEWAEKLPLKKVYIFGSRVRGDATAGSDLDVAIEFEFPLTVNEAIWNLPGRDERRVQPLPPGRRVANRQGDADRTASRTAGVHIGQ